MRQKDLLRELASLTYAARQLRMVDLGRTAAAGTPSGARAAALIAKLLQGEAYERRLALRAGWGSRDPQAALSGLADRSRLARVSATGLAAALCDAAQLTRAMVDMPRPARRSLLANLRRCRRHDTADACLQALADRADPDFAKLLTYGSQAFVAQRLPDAAGSLGGLDWRALARDHPRTTAKWLTEAVQAATELDGRLAAQIRTAFPFLSERLPDAAVKLARALADRMPLAGLPLQRLVHHRPEALTDLCLAACDSLPVPLAGVAHRLGETRLLATLGRFGSVGETPFKRVRWLRRLRPAQRDAAYALVGHGWRDAAGAIAVAILTLLPRAPREAEARRHLQIPALTTRPLHRLPYAGLLPWHEARTLLDPYLGDPEPALRGAALAALAACVRFERRRAPDLLALAQARRHEQDPVRASLLGAMAALPPCVWQADHLAGLGAVFRHALDATDLSAGSASQIGRLLVAQMSRHPDWATEWVGTLIRERGRAELPGIGERLRPEDVRRLAPALMPVLRQWAAREREAPLMTLAATLGRNLLPAWDELVVLVEQIALHGKASAAAAALHVLARFVPGRLHTLVPALLRQDPSWITQPPVHDHLHRYRQDLLTPFLGRTACKGRFATGRTRFVLPFRTGFERWSPDQQSRFEATLTGVVADAARDSPALLQVIAQLAALPDSQPDALVRLAALDTPHGATRDAALRGLGRRDLGDGLPTLVAALDDARGRVAAYALRGSVLELPTDGALDILRGAPVNKVTVAKEVVRLVGELPGDAAFRWLVDMDASALEPGGVARDVRVAVLRAMWSRLERDEAWAILDRAARAPDPAVAAAVARVPGDLLSPDSEERLTRIFAALLAHPEPRVRAATLGRCITEPLADRAETLLAPLLGLLSSALPDECRQAAVAVFATYVGHRAIRVGEAACTVRANRFAISVLMTQLRQWAVLAREPRAATVQAVLGALRPDPFLAGVCAALAASVLPADALVAYFRGALDTLHAGALASAGTALATARGLRPESLQGIEAALHAADDERLRRLALAALCAQATGAGRGWTNALIGRLIAFRADASPLVAEAAQFIFPPDERTEPETARTG